MPALLKVKRALFVFVCVILLLFLHSCKNNQENIALDLYFSRSVKRVAISPSQITCGIIESSSLSGLTVLPSGIISKHFDLPPEGIESISAYVSNSEYYADTIVVFKLSDTSKSQEVLASVSKYISQLSENFRLKNAAEHQKIKNAVVLEQSGYILLYIGDNPKAAENLFKQMIKSKGA